MVQPAHKPMEIAEFLRWDGERDIHYQLRDGVPVAMAPPAPPHQILCGNLVTRLGRAVEQRRPCTVRVSAGLVSPSRARTYHEADIAVFCPPQQPSESMAADPVLVVEVLSPSTADDDRRIKLPDYRMIGSVREIVLIDSRSLYCEVHRRQPDDRWVTDLLRDPGSLVRLESVGLEAELSSIYEYVPLEIS